MDGMDEMFDAVQEVMDKQFVSNEVEIINKVIESFAPSDEDEDKICIQKMISVLKDAFTHKLENGDTICELFGDTNQVSIQKSLERISLSKEYCREMLAMLSMMEMGCNGAVNASKAYYGKLEASFKRQYGGSGDISDKEEGSSDV